MPCLCLIAVVSRTFLPLRHHSVMEVDGGATVGNIHNDDVLFSKVTDVTSTQQFGLKLVAFENRVQKYKHSYTQSSEGLNIF